MAFGFFEWTCGELDLDLKENYKIMTLFLRNNKNQSIVDIEINFGKEGKDLSSVVVVEYYSQLLLDNLDRSKELIEDFSEIDELRGWFWEYYMEMTPNPSQKDCVEKVGDMLASLAKKYNLNYITD